MEKNSLFVDSIDEGAKGRVDLTGQNPNVFSTIQPRISSLKRRVAPRANAPRVQGRNSNERTTQAAVGVFFLGKNADSVLACERERQ